MSARPPRGACPALSAPMQTGDGLLVRLSPASGSFTPAQLGGLAEAASRHGNSIVEVTARGSLQIRGLETDTVAPLAADIDALGIAVRTGVPVESGPLAGLDPAEIADPRPLAEAIRSAIAATDLPRRLGPKVSVIVDGGGALHLGEVIADVRLAATGSGPEFVWQLSIAGTAKTGIFIAALNQHGACEAGVFILTSIAELGRQGRARDLDPALVRTSIARLAGDKPSIAQEEDIFRARAEQSASDGPPPLTPPHKGEGNRIWVTAPSSGLALLGHLLPEGRRGAAARPATSSPLGERVARAQPEPGEGDADSENPPPPLGVGVERSPIGIFNFTDGRAALGVGLPFGQIEASRLAGFCRVAGDAGVAEIRIAPGRAILLLGETSTCAALQAIAPRHGLIVDPADARLGIAACPGNPACASGHIAARAIAEQLAALGHGIFDQSLAVHVSGCVKGCARPGPADLTFVGHAEGVDLVVGGKASGMADVRLEHAEIRHGFARLASLYREKRRSGESASSCFSRLGASCVGAAFRGQS